MKQLCIKNTNIILIFCMFCYIQSFLGVMFSFWIPITLLGWMIEILIIITFGIKCKISKIDGTLFIIIILGQILGFLNSLTTRFPDKSIYLLFEFTLCFIILYFLSANLRVQIDSILIFIIIVAFVSAIYAMIFQLGKEVFSFRDESHFSIANIYVSFWSHRNIFALILLAGIVGCLYFLRIVNSKRKIGIYMITIFLIVNLILTLSRSAYLGLALFLSIDLIMNNKVHKKYLIISVGFLIFCIFVYHFNNTIKNIVDIYMIRKVSGSTGRDSLWKMAITFMDGKTVVFGRGMGIEKEILETDPISLGAGFHNLLISLIIEGGIVYVISMMTIIMRLYKKFKKYYRIKNVSLYSWGIASFFCFLGYSMFETTKLFNLGVGSFILTFFMITSQNILINSYKNI